MREMKDSGIYDVDYVPNEWTVKALKYICTMQSGDNLTAQEIEEDDGFPVYGGNGLRGYYSSYNTKGRHVLIGRQGALCGNIHVVDGQFWATDHAVVVYNNTTVETRYLGYLLQTMNLNQYSVTAAQPGLSVDKIINLRGCFPCFAEQTQIAKFLDSKCAEIDALSTDIQSEIDTLEAYKRSKVFDTVVHGIDHNDFIHTDSDVWATIPKGWKLVDIKYIFEIVKRIAGKEGYDVIAITQQGLKYKDISSNEGQLASDYSGYQFVYPGDYAMNHMDLLTGWVDLSDKFGVTSPDYRVFRLRYPDAYDRKYYKYIMQCCYMNHIFYSLGQGVSNLGRWRLQTSAFNNFKVPVPPYEEQVKIGNYLDEEISQINSIIAQKQEQLAVLADYKKSVIYEYVTGKKEVPAV